MKKKTKEKKRSLAPKLYHYNTKEQLILNEPIYTHMLMRWQPTNFKHLLDYQIAPHKGKIGKSSSINFHK